ncbi:MAG TPA: hypothetical protein VE779_09935 [Candidatus Angelobacter sp.]|nr:hypothetical protein [Candidatus Angelobacter sp.]
MGIDSTMVGGLPLPQRLLALIDSGFWSRTADDAMRQNSYSVVSAERIHLFAPEENRIILYPPPFRTISEEMGGEMKGYWSEWGALEEISPDLAVPIGDFGLGSDTAVVLDYRSDRGNPSVIRLLWRQPPQPNTWVRCADSFDEFVHMLELDQGSPPLP